MSLPQLNQLRKTARVLSTLIAPLIAGLALDAGTMAKAQSHNETSQAMVFTIESQAGQDAAPIIRKAIEYCRENNVRKIKFTPGVYNIWPDAAVESFLYVSNNDAGLKRIGFEIVGSQGLEIDGSGAIFMFRGQMVPFLIERSSNITLKNITFDFLRPFHSEGKVLAITPESVDLEFSEEFPYAISNGILVFTGPKRLPEAKTTTKEEKTVYPYGNILAFDAVKREPAYMAKDRYGLEHGIVAQAIGPRQVRLQIDRISAEVGNILVFGPPRENPGVVVSDSNNVRLENFTIHHCGGMGVIAQRSADVFLHKVKVVPPAGEKRVVSITADATHFVNMKGRIELTDCVFEGQKDDATNVHGLYARITRLIAKDEIEVKLVHPQQFGVDFIKPGTRLELVHGGSLTDLGYGIAKEVRRLNKEYTLVKLENPLPETVAVGDSVADADANTADVLIKNCIIGKNRARGILLGSRGRMVVEGNTFHTPGAAILFEGDARFWYEQAGVRNVVIRDNIFDNCNYGVWGNACIQVGTGMDKDARKTTHYNKNITIENNLFRVFDSTPLLNMYAVDGLVFRKNRMELTQAYPARPEKKNNLFVVTDSDNVTIEEPEVVGVSIGRP